MTNSPNKVNSTSERASGVAKENAGWAVANQMQNESAAKADAEYRAAQVQGHVEGTVDPIKGNADTFSSFKGYEQMQGEGKASQTKLNGKQTLNA